MRNIFEDLKKQADYLNIGQLSAKVDMLVSMIISTDSELISVRKKFESYGTYKSEGFANEYHFGKELSEMIKRALSSKVTNDEDKIFSIKDFREEIFNIILESI